MELIDTRDYCRNNLYFKKHVFVIEFYESNLDNYFILFYLTELHCI